LDCNSADTEACYALYYISLLLEVYYA
jgi:hypothetical protein